MNRPKRLSASFVKTVHQPGIGDKAVVVKGDSDAVGLTEW